jgi:hypothetical protein
MGKASRGKWVRRAVRFWRLVSRHRKLDAGYLARHYSARQRTWARALARVPVPEWETPVIRPGSRWGR